jgi:MATE family multidrug resistance protein
MAADATARPQGRTTWLGEARANLALALPIAIAFLAQMATLFVDNVMVGRLGADELAAGGLGANLQFTPLLLGMGVLAGVAAIASHALGAGDRNKAAIVARQGLRLSLALSLPCTLLLLGMILILPNLGYDPRTVRLAQGLLIWCLPGVPGFLAYSALRFFATAANRPRIVTIVAILSVGVTALSNYLFVYGSFGMPRLGVPGIGLSGTISCWLQFLAVALYLRLDPEFHAFRVFSNLTKPDPAFWEILRLGWPIAGSYMFENGLFVATTLLIAVLGNAALAANAVVGGLCSFTFMIPYAVGQAATVRVGRAVGARQAAAARRAGYTALHLGVIWMLLAATLFLTLPRFLIGLYVNLSVPGNQAMLAIALTLLPIAALFQVFDGTQAVASGALRGLKDTRVPMVICFVGYWLVGITAASILGFWVRFGAVGFWLGLALGLAATAILLSLRFHRLAKRLGR